MWTGRRIVIGWAVLAAWVIAVLIWATLPATDHVPTGVIDGVNTSIIVECGAPLDGSAGPAEPVPPVEPPRALQHIPCEAQHRSNQISLVINAVVALAAAAFLVTVTRRRRATGATGAQDTARPQPVAV
jgi:hypothetical protein